MELELGLWPWRDYSGAMMKLASTKRPGSRGQAETIGWCARGPAIAVGGSGGGGAVPGLGIGPDSGILTNRYLCGESAVSWQDGSPISGIAPRTGASKTGATGSGSVLLSVGYEGCTSLAPNLIRGSLPGSLQSFEILEMLETRAITGVPGAYRRGYKAEFYHRRDGQQHRISHAFPTLRHDRRSLGWAR